MKRLDQLRAVHQISGRTGCNVEDIEHIVIWGNHSATQYAEIFHAAIKGKLLHQVVANDEYLNGAFISKAAKRGTEIISAMKKSSGVSAACEHMHDWWSGNQQSSYVSMSVIRRSPTWASRRISITRISLEKAVGLTSFLMMQ